MRLQVQFAILFATIIAQPLAAVECVDWSRTISAETTISGFAAGRIVELNGYLVSAREQLVVYDVSSPTQPSVVSQIGLPGPATRLRVAGACVAAACGAAGVAIVDLADPLAPVLVGCFAADVTVIDVAFRNDLVLALTDSGTLLVLAGVGGPESGPFGQAPALYQVGSLDGITDSLCLGSSDTLTLVGTRDGIALINLDDAAHPMLASRWIQHVSGLDGHTEWGYIGPYFSDLAIAGDIVVAASRQQLIGFDSSPEHFPIVRAYVILVDFSQPLLPEYRCWQEIDGAHTLTVTPEYVIGAGRGFIVVERPQSAEADLAFVCGAHSTRVNHAIAMVGHHLYATDVDDAVYHRDLTWPAVVSPAASVPTTDFILSAGGRWRVYGRYAGTMGDDWYDHTFRVFDLEDPAQPVQRYTGSFSSWGSPGSLRLGASSDSRIVLHRYVCPWEYGWERYVVTITDVDREITAIVPAMAAWSVLASYPSHPHVLWSNDEYDYGTLVGWDVSDVANIAEIARLQNGASVDRCAFDETGTLVFFDGEFMRAIDVSNPVAPVLRSTIPSPNCISFNQAVLFRAGVLYMVCETELLIYTGLDTAAPSLAASLDLGWHPWWLTRAGSRVVAADANGFQIVDVTDPVAPFLASPFVPQEVDQVVANGDLIYLATTNGDIVLYDATDPDQLTFVGQAWAERGSRATVIHNGAITMGKQVFPLHCATTTGTPGEIIAAPSPMLHVYPNPFNPSTSIELTLARTGPVEVDVFDLRGRRVNVLRGGVRSPGSVILQWDGTSSLGREMPSGTYLLRARADGAVRTAKIKLVR
ncbi:MAG: FlgD immunoglobulin-like domain containing protein [Candidatus Krumholzibacteria bacterium]|jgi:hypothetical protein|nr:FlgD immunoglobulin-like domain containing protein [Candidatus Krumholzibacteria bacterium]